MRIRRRHTMDLYEILIPFHSNNFFLKLCVDSLIATTPDNVKITIIANNENPDEIDVAFSNSRVNIIKVNHSLYYPYCVNYGMQFITSENVFIIDADTYHLQGWFESITHLYESLHDVGIIGSALLEMSTNKIKDFGLGFTGYNWVQIYKGQDISSAEIRSREFQAVCTASCLVNKKIFQSIGGFSEYCNISYSDIDLCIRMAEKGYKILGCVESKAYHRGNTSQRIIPILKADCYAIFMTHMYNRMKIDIPIFIKESYKKFSTQYATSAQYIMLNLSSLNNYAWFKEQLESIMNTRIVEIYHYPSENRDETAVNLVNRIHSDIYRNVYPFIYFVDLFSSLKNNQFWKELRSTNIKFDIIVDRHGTVRSLLDIIVS